MKEIFHRVDGILRTGAAKHGAVTLVCVAVGLLNGTGLAAQDSDVEDGGRRTIRSVVASGTVSVDGRLEEAAWLAAERVSLPYEVVPGQNVPAPVGTECRVMHDDERLYLGCEAADPEPSLIRAYVTARDAVSGQDRIEFTVVPFDDGRRGYRFVVTPLGQQADVQVLPGSSSGPGAGSAEDASWNAAWSSAGQLSDGGYTIEAAIPFSELRFSEDASGWGFRVQRYWPRGSEVRLRSEPWDREDACDLCQTARLEGLSAVRAGGAMRVTPTVTASRTSVVGGGSTSTADAGGELLWTPRPSTALGVAVNPDFSHIEADDARIDANERFALFVQERRPFFLEGADLFSTPLQLFFSRTVVDPDAAAKLTAKWGSTGVGAIWARDAGATVLIPGREGSRVASLAGTSDAAVLRVRQDVGRASSIGFMTTSRLADDYSNHTASFDAVLQPVPAFTARVQLAGSRTEDPMSLETGHEGPFVGFGGTTTVRYATREWNINGIGFWREDDLRLDAGFVPQVGVHGADVGVSRQFLAGRGSWYHRIAIGAGAWNTRFANGDLSDQGIWVGSDFEGPYELRASAYLNMPNRVGSNGRVFNVPYLYSTVSIRPVASVRFSGVQIVGEGVDFAAGEPASLVEFTPRVEARIGRRIDVAIRYPYRRLGREGRAVLVAQAAELRALYGISSRASLRVVAQVERESRESAAPMRGHLVQAVFSWELDPQRVVRIGVAVSGGDVSPSTSSAFLKLGYAWRP
jgi:hypothetical protein